MRRIKLGFVLLGLVLVLSIQNKSSAQDDIKIVSDMALLNFKVVKVEDPHWSASSNIQPKSGNQFIKVTLEGTLPDDGAPMFGANDVNLYGFADDSLVSIPSFAVGLEGSDKILISPATDAAWDSVTFFPKKKSESIGIVAYFEIPKALTRFTVRVLADAGSVDLAKDMQK
ncbi:MAG: hypothetical protein IT324_10225 [Anaerolineae bacterium]|nr:hypothetical protein [Anaerolineae bacterium]